MIGIIRRRRIFWLIVLSSTFILFFFVWNTSLADLHRHSIEMFPESSPIDTIKTYYDKPNNVPKLRNNSSLGDTHSDLEYSDPIEINEIQNVNLQDQELLPPIEADIDLVLDYSDTDLNNENDLDYVEPLAKNEKLNIDINDQNQEPIEFKVDNELLFDYFDPIKIYEIQNKNDSIFPKTEEDIASNSSEYRFQQLSLPESVKYTTKPETEFISMGIDSKKNNRLIIDTPGCKLPKFDPFDPNIIDLYNETSGKYPCKGNETFLFAQTDNSIALNETALKMFYNLTKDDLYCYYSVVERLTQEEKNNTREENIQFKPAHPINFGIPIPEDNIAVICNIEQQNSSVKHFFPLVHIKGENEPTKTFKSTESLPLNVIILGIDSVSKLNFLRQLPKTKNILEQKMFAFDMMGYTKVGDNTFPNIVPLLTGHQVEYYFNESLGNVMYFNDLDFIWKDYAERGFRTFFAEDHPVAGTFNYLKRGFRDPPTEYYYRPISIAMDYAKSEARLGHQCVNSDTDSSMIRNFMRRFFTVMDNRPYFAFAMVSSTTHDNLNYAGYEDDPTSEFLEDLYDSGVLNKSALVLFSDHGIRFGDIRERYIGKFEERMPFLYLYFPQWFNEKYPNLLSNLRTNQKRLVTLFDVHATLLHLLNIERIITPGLEYSEGISLFEQISPERTCENAKIPQHFCPCQSFEERPLDDRDVLKSMHVLIDSINEQLHQYSKCAHLDLEEPLDARLGRVNEEILNFNYWTNLNESLQIHHEGRVPPLFDYLVTLKTKPGGGIFEGTVRHDWKKNSFDVLGISRINMYGNQSSCIDSQKLKLYCYCET